VVHSGAATKTENPLPRNGVAMDGLRGEGWQADRDVFGAFRARSAVLNPFARMSDDRLASGDVHEAVLMGEAKRPLDYDSEFVEFRFLARFNPTAWAAHVGHAEAPEFTRPTNSSINFGLLPAAVMRVGVEMNVGMDSSFQSDTFMSTVKNTCWRFSQN
jgi:hypothetical protein